MKLFNSRLTNANLIFNRWVHDSKLRLAWFKCKSLAPPTRTPMQITVMPNGLRVVTEPCPSFTTCIGLFVAAGPRYEHPQLNGISHFIEHMAFQGFRTTPRTKLEEFVDQTGTKFGVKTRRDMQVFRAHLIDPNCASSVVEILSKVVKDIEFAECEIEYEKYNMCLEMVEKDFNPRAVVFDYLYQTAFQGTPLAQHVIGPSQKIQIFDRDTATSFMMDHFEPTSMILAAAGNVSHKDMLRFAECQFGDLIPPDCKPDSGDCPCRYTGSEVTYRDDTMDFAHVAIAVEAPGLNSPDYLPMLIAKNMMGRWNRGIGGNENNGILLARATSTSDLCFSYKPFYNAHKDVGLWGIYFITEKRKIEDMISNVQDVWMRMYSILLETDLKQAKNLTKHKLAKRVYSVQGIVNDLGTQVLQTNGRITYRQYCEKIDSMKLSKFKSSVEKYLDDRCPVVSAVGPVEALPEYNRTRSGMYWLRV